MDLSECQCQCFFLRCAVLLLFYVFFIVSAPALKPTHVSNVRTFSHVQRSAFHVLQSHVLSSSLEPFSFYRHRFLLFGSFLLLLRVRLLCSCSCSSLILK